MDETVQARECEITPATVFEGLAKGLAHVYFRRERELPSLPMSDPFVKGMFDGKELEIDMLATYFGLKLGTLRERADQLKAERIAQEDANGTD